MACEWRSERHPFPSDAKLEIIPRIDDRRDNTFTSFVVLSRSFNDEASKTILVLDIDEVIAALNRSLIS
jgi:prephenate dehydratase